MDICRRFGANVRRLRRTRDITQEDLADLAGIHSTYLSALERSGGRNPTLRVMDRIAKALGVSIAELLAEQEDAAQRDQPGSLGT